MHKKDIFHDCNLQHVIFILWLMIYIHDVRIFNMILV